MTVVIPMAGTGDRFVKQGYKDPKPIISVAGTRLFESVLTMFGPEDTIHCVCNDQHVNTTNLLEVIRATAPSARVTAIPAHNRGPVYTVLAAFHAIPNEQPIMVSYCDGVLVFDRSQFLQSVENQDGCLFTHTGFQPHALGATKMAFLRVDDAGRVLEVKEKSSYTDTPSKEHASSGLYYFKSGALLKKYFLEAFESGLNYNGECYVTLVFNLMIRDGLNVGYFDTDVAILGTPEDVRNYEAWTHIVRESFVKSESDLLSCYEYWKRFDRALCAQRKR